jgi:hypothetical protein
MMSRGHHISGSFTSSQKYRRNNNISSNKFKLDEPHVAKFQNTEIITSTGPWASTRSKVAKNYLEETNLGTETGPWASTRSKIVKKYLAAEIKSNIEKNYLLATTSGVSHKFPISSRNISVSKKNSETLFQRIPGGLVPKVETLESGACERLHYITKNTFTLRNLLYLSFFIFISFVGYVGYVFLDIIFLAE